MIFMLKPGDYLVVHYPSDKAVTKQYIKLYMHRNVNAAIVMDDDENEMSIYNKIAIV